MEADAALARSRGDDVVEDESLGLVLADGSASFCGDVAVLRAGHRGGASTRRDNERR